MPGCQIGFRAKIIGRRQERPGALTALDHSFAVAGGQCDARSTLITLFRAGTGFVAMTDLPVSDDEEEEEEQPQARSANVTAGPSMPPKSQKAGTARPKREKYSISMYFP